MSACKDWQEHGKVADAPSVQVGIAAIDAVLGSTRFWDRCEVLLHPQEPPAAADCQPSVAKMTGMSCGELRKVWRRGSDVNDSSASGRW